MAREIQNHITGIESLLNGESMERATIRSPGHMIHSLAAEKETNTVETISQTSQMHAGQGVEGTARV